MRSFRVPFAAAITLAGLTVSSCSEEGPGTTAPDEEGVVTVTLTANNRFSPANVTVEPGTRVRWVNAAAIFHTVTPDGHTEFSRATTTSAGLVMEHTFQETGTFDYFCEPHLSLGMVGRVIVE